MNEKPNNPQINAALRYSVSGVVFGFLFPLISTIIKVATSRLPFNISNVVYVQRIDPLLWVIDSAPLILGLFAAYAGNKQDVLSKLNEALLDREKELKANQLVLERNIREHNDELRAATLDNQRRATQLAAIAQLANTIATIRELSLLLPAITEVISEKFNVYHVSLFLNDEAGEYTKLAASNSRGGKQLVERGHKVKIGEAGMVGYVAETGTLRIALDTGTETTSSFYGPDLPETRSELSLPMKVGKNVLGVLDLQSKQENPFDETVIGILSILADQIAIAIQNARDFQETQATLAESQVLYGNMIRQAWNVNAQKDQKLGYRYTGTTPTLLEKPITSIEALSALERGETVSTAPANRKNENMLAVPLKLRGEIIGVINVKMPLDLELGNDETDIVQATAERIAFALENSSLLEESQRRAAREQTISQISAKIGAGTEIDTILKTAVRELGTQISGSQVTVEIGSENE